VTARIVRLSLAIFTFATSAPSQDPKPETIQAFDRYVQLTEAALKERMQLANFLWFDKHDREKSLAWLNQDLVVPQKTLDHGEEIQVPGGLIQDWLGVMFLTGVTMENVRDAAQNYKDYKYYFKQEVIESKQLKREGDHWQYMLRFQRRQLKAVTLNATCEADWSKLDDTHLYGKSFCAHIGEVKSLNKPDEELPAGSQHGYLWRLNTYWRLEQNDGGVYAEVEQISLSRDTSRLAPARYLNGFIENFPQASVEHILSVFRQNIKPPKAH
jgi:hypothetical protein